MWLGSLAGQTGSAGSSISDEQIRKLEGQGLRVVDVPEALYASYYEGFSNGVVWPLFHYMPERADFSAENWQAFRQVNAIFAEAILREARDGDTVWIHDYQLMLVPELIRRERRGLAIGFFLHIPFPAAELFRIMPWRRELLSGVLGADLVGFHTLEYVRHFSNSCARVLGLEPRMDSVHFGGRTIRMGAYPLGIDVRKLHADARSPKCEKVLREFDVSYQGKRLLLGVDRLDYTKGIPQRLRAFSALLERNPDFVGKVSLVQVSIPSRIKVDEYQEMKSEIDGLVGQINGRFGMPGYVPIHYLFRTLTRDYLYALYRRADVCLVTPIRDGLNLVCKEYVAAKGADPGVLVLSEFAGSAAEMGEAIIVNPWSEDSVVEGMELALSLSREAACLQMSNLYHRLSRRDNDVWSTGFLAALAKVHRENGDDADRRPAEPELETLRPRFANKRHVYLFLDYDGTLVPIADKPELALPDEVTLALLKKLCANPSYRVVVASGRDREFLERHLPAEVSLICEHGACVRCDNTGEFVQLVEDGGMQEVWDAVLDVMRDFESRIPGSRIERKEYGLVWHYRMAEPIFAQQQAAELAEALGGLLQRTALGVGISKKAVEVRHTLVNKGDGVRYVLRKWQFDPALDGLLTAGDDRTDEDMFRVWPKHNVSIGIGDVPMSAAYATERDTFIKFLDGLVRSD